jgi:hypothetical protein
LNLKFLNELAASTDKNFKFTALVAVLVGLRNQFFRFPRMKPTSANEATGQNHSENNVWR